MANAKLIAARLHKFWTQADLAEEVGVTFVTISRWENGVQQPQAYAVKKLCQVFASSPEELGLNYEPHGRVPEQMRARVKQLQEKQMAILPPMTVGTFPHSTTASIIVPSLLPESLALTNAFDRTTRFLVTICGLVNRWQGQATHCADLQVVLSQEFAMFEQDASQAGTEEQNHLSRRQAFVAIAALPFGALAATRHAGMGILPEEFLPQSTAAITSCWSIMQSQDFGVIEQALSHCLPALSTLAQQSSPYQQTAAGLAAQGNLLLSLVAHHQQPPNARQQLFYSKQAAEQAEQIVDPTLRILSLHNAGAAERILEDFPAMLVAYEEAVRLSNHELVSSTLRRKAYIQLARAYAAVGETQQALYYHSELKTSLPSNSEQVPIYLQDGGPFIESLKEAQMFEELGKQGDGKSSYKRGWKAMEQAEGLLSSLAVPERFRLEGVNQKALLALRLGYLDQFRDLFIQGMQGARTLQSGKRRQEVVANWKEARKVWPREPRVIELADLLLE